MLGHVRVSDEVFYSDQPITLIDPESIGWLKRQAQAAPRRRARLCAHPDAEDGLHEMLIALGRISYVRPHRHRGKSESFHLIEGSLTVLIFGDDGSLVRTIDMAAADPSRPFYYRLNAPLFHTVVPTSDPVVFHEVTNGPFRRQDTDFAPWAPVEGDEAAIARWRESLPTEAQR